MKLIILIVLLILLSVLFVLRGKIRENLFFDPLNTPCVDGCLTNTEGRATGTCLATIKKVRCEDRVIRDFITELESLRCPACRTLYKINSNNRLSATISINGDNFGEQRQEEYKKMGYCWAKNPKMEKLLSDNWRPGKTIVKCNGPGPTLIPSDWLIEDKALTLGYILPNEGFTNPNARYRIFNTIKNDCNKKLQTCTNDGKWMQYFNSDFLQRPVFHCVSSFMAIGDQNYNAVLSKDKCEVVAQEYSNKLKKRDLEKISSFGMIGYLGKPGTAIKPEPQKLKCQNYKRCVNLLRGTSNAPILNSSKGIMNNIKTANCVKRETTVVRKGKYATRIPTAVGYYYQKPKEEIPSSCLTTENQCADPNIGFGNVIMGKPWASGNPCI